MEGISKLFVFLLLLALLYALWRHQQNILNTSKKPTKKKRRTKIIKVAQETASDSDMSKFSIPSEEIKQKDTESSSESIEDNNKKRGYKMDSIMDNESINSYGNFSFIENASQNSGDYDNNDFFFQKKR